MTELASVPADGQTASERLALAVARPAPPQPTEFDLRALEAAQDEADEMARRIYGLRDQPAA